MTSTHDLEKLGRQLVDELDGDSTLAASGLRVRNIEVSPLPLPVLRATVEIPDLTDWTLRHHVLRVAGAFEDEHRVAVRCFFRLEAGNPVSV